jgi:hypothetical protein
MANPVNPSAEWNELTVAEINFKINDLIAQGQLPFEVFQGATTKAAKIAILVEHQLQPEDAANIGESSADEGQASGGDSDPGDDEGDASAGDSEGDWGDFPSGSDEEGLFSDGDEKDGDSDAAPPAKRQKRAKSPAGMPASARIPLC